MSGVDTALARNAQFAASRGYADATVVPKLRLMVVACLDPRSDPAYVLGMALGEAMVVRNAGGRVTDEVLADMALVTRLAAARMPDAPPLDVAVIHHTECGTAALSNPEFAGLHADLTGISVEALADRAVLDPATTLARDVATIRDHPYLGSRVRVAGLLHDVETGTIRRQ